MTADRGQDHHRVGPYRLVQRLGEGGMGVVHLALDPHDRAVALKLMRPHVAADPLARARLGREFSTLRRVRHPRVAEVLDADLTGEPPYLVTRFVPGRPLDVRVQDEGPMAPADVAGLGRELGEALRAIHAAGVVHRDVKPGNVMLMGDGPVLIDFGIAHVADESRLTMTGLVMGTPGYLSPEVCAGEPVTPATDWWGWAATLAFAITGSPPFGTGPVEVILDRVRRGAAALAGVPEPMRSTLAAALAVEPRARPSGETLIARLVAPEPRGPQPAPTEIVPNTPQPAPRRPVGPAGRAGGPQQHGAAGRPDDPPAAAAAGGGGPRLPRRPLPAAGTVRISPNRPTLALPPAGAVPGVPMVPGAVAMAPGAPVYPGMAPGSPAPGGPVPMGPVPVRAPAVPMPPPAPMGPPMAPMAPMAPTGVPPAALPGAGHLPRRAPMHDPHAAPWRAAVVPGTLLTLAVTAAVLPAFAVVVAVVLVIVVRVVQRSEFALWQRRRERGARSSDTAILVAALPWRTAVATVATALALVLPAVMGVSATFFAAVLPELSGGEIPGGDDLRPLAPMPLAVGMAMALVSIWWGPGGAAVRQGTRSTVRVLAAGRAGAVVVLTVLALILFWDVTALNQGVQEWWPLSGPPQRPR